MSDTEPPPNETVDDSYTAVVVRVDPDAYGGTHTFEFDPKASWVVDSDQRLHLYRHWKPEGGGLVERVVLAEFARGQWRAVLRVEDTH